LEIHLVSTAGNEEEHEQVLALHIETREKQDQALFLFFQASGLWRWISRR
jgi:hypothetical protein